jgi:PKHD-type hydroxylase
MQAQIPLRNAANANEIGYWENFLSEEDINFILALPQWTNNYAAQIGGGTGNAVLDPWRRTTTVGWMEANDETAHIWSKIVNTVAEINRTCFHYDLTGCYEPAQLGIYKADDGSHYTWHSDDCSSSGNTPRKLSMALMLDDPTHFEGGELQVMYRSEQPQTLEQKRGRAWFFPSWMLHRVTPVTKGVRRSLVLWVGGPAFK